MKKIIVLILACLIIGLTAVSAEEGYNWPSASKLAQYGLNNMPKPAGMGEIDWNDLRAAESWGLYNYDVLNLNFYESTSAAHSAILAWFQNNGWTFKSPPVSLDSSYYAVFVKGTYQVNYDVIDYRTNEASGSIVAGNTGIVQTAPAPPPGNPADIITPAGKAWVIQDNQVLGSGKAIVLKADGNYECYERILGIWRPESITLYAENTYSATGNRLNLTTSNRYYSSLAGDFNYTISNNGSTLTISLDDYDFNDLIAGTYTLSDAPRVQAPGGNIVNPAGTAWEISHRGGHDIYHTDGILYVFGGSGTDAWSFAHDIWNTYTITSEGSLTRYYHDNRRNKPEVFNYSITDFGNGNKTLRMWRVDRMFPYDEVWKLVPTPSGFRLPSVR